jgi:hypothetical protein
MLLSGPAPLRVLWVNGASPHLAGAPRPGDDLEAVAPWLSGSALSEALTRLFATDEPTASCTHPAWPPGAGEVDSLLYRVPGDNGEAGVVAIVQLARAPSGEERRQLAKLERKREQLDRRLERHARWLATIAELAELYRRESGATLLQATVDTLVRRLPPIDAGIGVYMGGELALGSSSRGMLGPRMVTVAAHADLAEVLREGAPAWLDPATAAAFGAPRGVSLLAVPVSVLGETLGAALLVLDEQPQLDADLRHLLTVLSATIGFALLRDRLVEGARTAGR